MILVCKKFKKRQDIPSRIRKQLWMLSFGNVHIGSALVNILSTVDNTKLAYAVDHRGVVLAWGGFDSSWSANREIHIYTRKAYRRQGLGSRIYRALMVGENKKEIVVSPHDEASVAFYKKLGKRGTVITFCQCPNCYKERTGRETGYFGSAGL